MSQFYLFAIVIPYLFESCFSCYFEWCSDWNNTSLIYPGQKLISFGKMKILPVQGYESRVRKFWNFQLFIGTLNSLLVHKSNYIWHQRLFNP